MNTPPNCGIGHKRSGPRKGRWMLLAKSELRDEVGVALLVLAAEIIQQRTTLVHQHQKAAARMVVLRVRLEMLGQVLNSLREDRDLDLGRPGVLGRTLMFLDKRLLALRGNRHRQHSCSSKG